MTRKSVFAVACLAAIAGSIAIAQPAKDTKPKAPAGAQPAGQPELPPGMTAEDMQACMAAATPGKMHEHLAKGVGVWAGKNTMWMTPEAKPMNSECTSTVSAMLDGRYYKCEMAGDMPGMGPFNGFGISGFDNVSQKFQATWIDNCGTGMMTGTGTLSDDGKTMEWKYTYNCPIQKKPVTMRQIEKYTGPDTMTMTMFGPEPHTGKEYKVMEIQFTRKTTAVGEATR